MKNKFNFNPKRFFELNEKKFLFLPAHKELPRSEKLELSYYSNQYFEYLWWQERESFLILVDKFINSEIDSDDFSYEFERLWYEKQKLRTRPSLETLQAVKMPDIEELDYFWGFIQSVSYFSELYDTNMEVSGIQYGLTEDAYQIKVDKAYQRFLLYDSVIDTNIVSDFELTPVDYSVNYDDFTVLKSTILFFTIITLLVYSFLKPDLFNLI